MESLATGTLIVLGLVAFANYKNRTLPDWLRAKFFNQGAADAQLLGPNDLPPRTGALLTQAHTGLGAGLGTMRLPASGPITSGFGMRDGKPHEGIDIAVPTGTQVIAARAGKVSYAGGSGGYGLRVDVEHGGATTRYAHLSHIDVLLGQWVAAGAPLGLSGATGNARGPHVHFEVRVGGLARDPSSYLGPGGVG